MSDSPEMNEEHRRTAGSRSATLVLRAVGVVKRFVAWYRSLDWMSPRTNRGLLGVGFR